jgi:hypothetical protein
MRFHLSLEPRSAIRFVQNNFCAYGTIDTNYAPISHRNVISHDPRHQFHQLRSKWFLSLWYVRHKPCTYLASWLVLSHTDWIEHPLEPRNLGVPSSASKTISEALLCLAQMVHLSCTDTYTVSKRTKQDSTWPKSPRSCIRCVQNTFQANGMFGENRAPILRQDPYYLEMDSNDLPLEPQNLGVPMGASKWFLSLWYI